MELLRPRAVIFDLGSTLIEYETVPWDELNRICVANAYRYMTGEGYSVPAEEEFARGFDTIRERYRRVALDSLVEWSVPVVARELFKKFGVEAGDGLVDRFFDAYYAPVAERIYVYDDVLDTLNLIGSRIGKMGLISNTIFPERAHRDELSRFGIEPYLDFAIFSSTFRLRKPHPDIFYKAANLAGLAPAECVYVGDRYIEDVTGPVGIGMTPILKIVEGREYPADMPASVRKISTLAELADHLDI